MFRFQRTLFSSDGIQPLLERNGFGTLDAIFAQGLAVERYRGDRVVFPVTLTDTDETTIQAFIKLNWGLRRLVPRTKDIRGGQMFQSLPAREWNGLERLRSLGLNVPRPLALFEDGAFQFRAAVVVSAVPVEMALSERLLRNEWQQLPHDRQIEQLHMIVSTIERIHARGLRWRGASTRHLFIDETPEGRPELWLIDCEGIQRGGSRHDIRRDFQKLLRSFRETGADDRTLEWLRQVCDLKRRPRFAA
ncbi:MAG: lipopolysaccharide kinase InaA family protein [Planctomycetaceae bacterium]